MNVSIVIPTVGRPSLATLLEALVPVPKGWELLVVVDRGGNGPAAARNAGWRAARHPWVVFLDDDVLPEPGWSDRLVEDLRVAEDVGGVQGRVRVPLPRHRRPTDWERSTHGLTEGRWITADMAYRRAALAEVGGFDERFPRAYREDAELAHRVAAAGWRLVRGRRSITHPVRPERGWVSVRAQRGNADDALLRRLYGPGWRDALGLPPGRRPRHLATTLAGATALAFGAAAARRRWAAGAAALAGGAWLVGTAELAAARIRPGPRQPREIAVMVLTSLVIPPAATWWWLRGWWRNKRALPWGDSS
jgi:cellulose synthase/poly-beta-1,6-N-acetylglucosamine synthase-like glycosyltransferase